MKRAELALVSIFIANVAMAHPLDGAIRNLAKAKMELSNIQDPALANEVGHITQKVTDVWADAVVAPVRATDGQLENLGFTMTEYNRILHYYEARRNSNATDMKRDAIDLKPERWRSLQQIAELQKGSVVEINSMIQAPIYVADFSESEKAAVTGFASVSRTASLDRISEQAKAALNCISYFSTQPQSYGLVPVANEDSVYAWSTTDLLRVHHAARMVDLGPNDLRSAKTQLREMLDKVNESEGICLSPSESAFIEAQANQLGAP